MQTKSWFGEVLSSFVVNIQSAAARPLLSIIVMFGFMAVVLVMVSVSSIGMGLNRTFANTGSPAVAVVLSSGAFSETVSYLSQEETKIIGAEPGVVQTRHGGLISPELIATADVPKVNSGVLSTVILRGVTSDAFVIHKRIHLIGGRMFQPGLNEAIVGRQAEREYSGLTIGSILHVGNTAWKIVGDFASGGDIHESEIWTDVQGLQTAFHAGNSYSVVYAKLISPAAYQTFSDAIKKDPRLHVHVMAEKVYYTKLGQGYSQLVFTVGFAITIIMALGSIISAINLMHVNLSARIGDIATLRALGFRRSSVLCAVISEGMVYGAIGGVVGGAMAYSLFNGYQAGTIFGGNTQVAFQFTVTFGLLVTGIFWALGMGLVGALFPAIRAARLPVAVTLREN